jgi:hypothetical protein
MLPSRLIVASFKCYPILPSAKPGSRSERRTRSRPSDRHDGPRCLALHRRLGVDRTEHRGVRDFAAPDLQPTLEGAQKPIAIGPRIFDLQSSKQLTASPPRLRSEPCVQLFSDLRQRVRSPTSPLLFRPGQRTALSMSLESRRAPASPRRSIPLA